MYTKPFFVTSNFIGEKPTITQLVISLMHSKTTLKHEGGCCALHTAEKAEKEGAIKKKSAGYRYQVRQAGKVSRSETAAGFTHKQGL